MYKVIIAEDELLIQEGIADFIRSLGEEYTVCGTAGDGESALRLIKTLDPDILITDIFMPHMDGLELISQCYERNPDMKVIIVSGHSEFQYAQRAMRMGVSAYLLKPVLPEEIEKAMRQIKRELQKRENFLRNLEELAQNMQENLPALRERYLERLVNGLVRGESIKERAEFFGLDFSGSLFCTVLIKLSRSASDQYEAREQELTEVLILRIADSLFEGVAKAYPFLVRQQSIALVLCVREMDAAMAFSAVNRAVKKMVNSFQRHFQVALSVAIGRLYPKPDSLPDSYREAAEALEYTFGEQTSIVVNYEDIRMQSAHPVDRPSGLITELMICIKFDDLPKVLEWSQKIFAHYAEQKAANAGLLKIEILEVALSMMRAEGEMLEGRAEFSQISRMLLYEDVEKSESLAQLEQAFAAFVKKCWEQYQQRKLGRTEMTAQKVQEYVRTYYVNADFSLDFIASQMFMSVNYLRQIFKQCVGESFVEYLTRVRMEKAASLLSQGNLRIQDVASAVGYENQRYFAICFKKYHQVTPSEYREGFRQQT